MPALTSRKMLRAMALTKLGKQTSTSVAMPSESGSNAFRSLLRCLLRTQNTVLMTSKAGQLHSLAVMHNRAHLQCAVQVLFKCTVLLTLECQPCCRSPERSMRLGAAFLNAVADVCTQL